jgi:hypothetical protein
MQQQQLGETTNRELTLRETFLQILARQQQEQEAAEQRRQVRRSWLYEPL